MVLFFLIALFDFREAGGSATVIFAQTTNFSFYEATATNPAVLTKITNNEVGLVHTKPFGVSSLVYNRGIVGLGKLSFGFSFSNLGQKGYNEYIFTLAKGFTINQELSYGLILKAYFLNIAGYGNDFMPGLNLGFLFAPKNYRLAMVLEDFNNPKSRNGDLIPATLRIGGAWLPVLNFKWNGDWLRNTQSERFQTGIEFDLLSIFSLRAGVTINPYQLAIGFGISYQYFGLDYAYRYHPRLKETQIISFALRF